MKNKFLSVLIVVIFSTLAAGCSDSGPSSDVAPVEEISVLGNAQIGEFDTQKGNFSLTIAPKDSEGNFIGEVNRSNFSMPDVTLTPAGSNKAAESVTTACIASIFVEVIMPGESEPINMILDFDTSGSMSWNDPNRLSIDAGKEIIDLLRDIDQAGIVEFGGSEAEVVQGLTPDKNLLRAQIDSLQFNGSTPLFDSIFKSLELLDDANATNPAVVILADGDNNRPPYDRDAVVAQANQQQTPLFAIALGDQLDFSDLIFFADNTGGLFAEAADAASLQELFDNVGFGIFQGRVVVGAECQFEPELPSAGQYEASGDLISSIGGNDIITPFGFSVNVSESSGSN